MARKTLPTALTIAGSDSGGGAGIQADLKTFAALGVHGTSAITCITAQNPKRVVSVQSIRPEIVRDQIEAVFSELRPHAIKTGMLFSDDIIRVIVNCLRRKRVPIVVDPVMVSTSGARLLKASAMKRLREELLPLATLVTPNLDEAEILLDGKLESLDDLRNAAREIQRRYGCAALVKGGHLEARGVSCEGPGARGQVREGREAVDFFNDGSTELMLTADFVRGVSTHGTGCTYSAAIAAGLARGHALPRAVSAAKSFITRSIAGSVRVRRHWVLGF